MSLAPGTRIGLYEVVAAVGAGGMGEVYRARDTRLHRDVALKILPDLFARDPERLARFEREARTLASLNHPHVAQVYGVEESGPIHALVMEFVDGEDLAQRISRAGPIPVEEALPMAAQIAEALEAAHEQGIIHRDLKPANIKVRSDGAVKVLDFGLAKALAPPSPGGAAEGLPGELANSPTITSPFQLSQFGVILGTAAYMSPEQAKGKAVDKRADIWAFGCVLYEMLTAKRPFPGEDVTDTLAAIVRADPDWAILPSDTPPAIRTLLRRCLEKDRRERLPDIGAARLELKESRIGEPPSVRTSPVPRRLAPGWWLLATCAALAAGAALATAYGIWARPAADTRVFTTAILLPASLTGAPALRLALSPDGRRLAFVAPDAGGTTMLWVRSLADMEPRVLPGTPRASAPFWSADSQSIAFLSDGKLRRIDAAGGPVTPLADAGAAPPGTWSRGDVIVFSSLAGGLSRIPATGGTPVPVTALATERGERIHITPFFLPDGRHFLYTASSGGSRTRGVLVGSLDSSQATRIVDLGSNAQYADGYLLFLRDTTLMAHRFDPAALTLSGTSVPLAVNVQINPATGTGAFSVSQTGVLVYQAGPSSGTHLVWRDRTGKDIGDLGTQSGNRDVQLSPDGRHAAITLPADTSDQPDVWIFDVATGLKRRFTFGGASLSAVWTPAGRRLVYGSRRTKATDLFQRDVAGTGAEEALLVDDNEKFPLGVSRDGRFLLYAVQVSAARGKLWVLPLTGDRTPRPLLKSEGNQIPGEISPDGRWVAYVSDETGTREVYVTSFPDAAGKWQISTSGGESPRWRADGKELFFMSNDTLAAADVMPAVAGFEFGAVKRLFDVRVPAPALGTRSTYAVSPDGQRILLNMWDPRTSSTPLVVVVNWPASLIKQ